MAAALPLGSIVWVEVPDPNGIFKLRPAVIVTPTEQTVAAERLHVVAITSRLSEPLPADHVCFRGMLRGIRALVSIESAQRCAVGSLRSTSRTFATLAALFLDR